MPLLCQNTLLLSIIFLSLHCGFCLRANCAFRLLQSCPDLKLHDIAQWLMSVLMGRRTCRLDEHRIAKLSYRAAASPGSWITHANRLMAQLDIDARIDYRSLVA